MVSLPLRAVFAVSFGSPLLAFLGVLVAQLIGRKGARELQTRSKREETLRTLRWAAELSVGPDDRLAELGVAELQALLGSDLLEEAQKTFVEAALSAVYGDPEEQLEQLGPGGEPTDVYVDADVTQPVPEDPGVRLALAPSLTTAEHAVTHAATTTYVAPAPRDHELRAQGTLDRRTRRLAFVSVTAEAGDVLVARSTLVKSIVPFA